MYTFVRGHGLLRDLSVPNWLPLDTALPVYSLYNDYRLMVVEATESLTGNTAYIDFKQLLEDFNYTTSSFTIQEIFNAILDATVPTVTKYPDLYIRKVKYKNYHDINYRVTLGKAGMNLPYDYPATDLPDVIVNTGDLSPKTVHQTQLISVNGFIHNTVADDNNLYVLDGGTNSRWVNQNVLGILDFTEIDSFTKIGFTENDIAHLDTTLPVEHRITLTSSVDITGKAWFMVVGGYIVFPDSNVVWCNDGIHVNLDLTALHFEDKILESSIFLDYRALGLGVEAIVDLNVIKELTWLKQWLSMNNTFLVVFDNIDSYGLRRYEIKKTNIPGQFMSYFRLDIPLFTGHGRLAEYLVREDNGVYSINVTDNFLRPFVVHTTNNEGLALNRVDARYANDLAPGEVLELYR